MAMDLSERKFEEDIETFLINEAGYRPLSVLDESSHRKHLGYSQDFCIYPTVFIEFLERTQPETLKKYRRMYKDDAEMRLIRELYGAIDNKGLIEVLRTGFTDLGTDINAFYPKPSSKLNETTNRLYEQNIFGVDRQFHYSNSNESAKTIDMVLSINGIPIFALELKNQFKGQDYQDAIEQYKADRNPHEYCFKLNRRFLAYFAVDLNEVWVSTQLKGTSTTFVPFNQGSNGAGRSGGKGNPINPNGYATSYLWEEVFQKDSVSKLIEKYVSYVETKKEIPGSKEKRTEYSVIFPRYHQLDVVDKLVDHVKQNGPGHNYLIEHSAGSGKSNSIAWLAYQLSSLHSEDNNPIFTSTIVVTNRIVLDNQLQDTIKSFEQVIGVLENIDKKVGSSGLKDAINDGARIIVCTIQKFLNVYKEFNSMKDKKFAIIIDEAHQGQNGESAETLRNSLADYDLEIEKYARELDVNPEDLDFTDEIINQIARQGHHDNQSFFAFTATPKRETLETFGEHDLETKRFYPFHVYSMRQAIEEGFILDVLQNFTAIKQAFKLVKTTEENPELVECDATKALMRYYKNNELTIANKVDIIMTNFLNNGRFKIGGQGKAMVVTDSRKAAVLYFWEIKKYIKDHPKECHNTDVLVAFSDEVSIDGRSYNEANLNIDKTGNSINADKKFRSAFKSGDYNIMVVADKYQMGFDEPLLHSMYVDKVLQGVNAVQTLSRLNRSHPEKEDTFVLDFVNTEDDMKEAFQPYYEETTLQGETRYNKVYDLKSKISHFGIYDQDDADKYFDCMSRNSSKNNTKSSAIGVLANCLYPAVALFNQLEEKDKADFKLLLNDFIKSYSYITSLVRIDDRELYKEYIYASGLIKFLPTNKRSIVDITDKVALEYVSLKKTFEGAVVLDSKDTTLTPVSGTKKSKSNKKDTLENIIEKLNDMFGDEFTEGDRVIVEGIYNGFMSSNDVARFRKLAKENNRDYFVHECFKDSFEDLTMECYEQNETAYKKLAKDSNFHNKVLDVIGNAIYSAFIKKGDTDDDK